MNLPRPAFARCFVPTWAGRSRLRVWLLLFAVGCHALLPVAHATAMSGDVDPWTGCGLPSPVLRAKLAALPAAVRAVLDPGSTASRAATDCAAYCAALAGPALPPARIPVADRVPTRATPPVPATCTAPSLAGASRPPARGPPTLA